MIFCHCKCKSSFESKECLYQKWPDQYRMSHLNCAALKKKEKTKKNICSFFFWKKTKILRADISDYAAKSMERMRKVFVDLITNCLVSSSDIVIGIVVVVLAVEVKIVSHCYYYYYRKVFLDFITNCYTSFTAQNKWIFMMQK